MLIVPYQSTSGGNFHWATKTPADNPCPWIVVQCHTAQTATSAGQWFSSMVRSAKGDPYARYGFRIMTSRRPYFVLAVAHSLPDILADFAILSPALAAQFPSQPVDRLLFKVVDSLLPPIPAGPSSSSSPPSSSDSSTSSSSTSIPSSSSTAPVSSTSDLSSLSTSASPAVPVCAICFEKPPAVIIIPCGHFGCCEECASPLDKCPFCRAGVERLQKIFNVSEAASFS
ncbi:MAG: RING-HC finger protein [archaeon]|nr:RING-HC finger protein [archaeon]